MPNEKAILETSNVSTRKTVSDDQEIEKSALQIHAEAIECVDRIETEYLRLFEILLVVEARKIYFDFEVSSLYIYCVELLQLSPQIAKDFGVVVRKSLEVSALGDAIRAQHVTISKARKICSVLDQTNHREWIELAMHCSCREVEKAVAIANPKEAVFESMRYATGDRLELRFGVSEEWAELLKKSKDLLSQRERRAVSTEEAIYILMRDFCQKNDPVEKAKRILIGASAGVRMERSSARGEHGAESVRRGAASGDDGGAASWSGNRTKVSRDTFSGARSDRVSGKAEYAPEISVPGGGNDSAIAGVSAGTSLPEATKRKRYIPAEVEHQVNLRDDFRCTYVDSRNRRCESRRWLEKHHIVHYVNGGRNSPENLETLCWAHHAIRHRRKVSWTAATL